MIRLALLCMAACATGPEVRDQLQGPRPTPSDLAPRTDQVDTLFGQPVADPYRSLEDAEAAAAWVAGQRTRFLAYTDGLPQRELLEGRFQSLWRYDDESVRTPCLIGARQTWRTKRADQDKWVVHVANGPQDPGRVAVDPNAWGETEQLASFTPSPDCRYAVVGRAQAGNEDPVLQVLDLDSLTYLPDAVRGWKQRGVAWKHDDSGFFYTSNPLKGEVADGDEFYFWRTWWHALRTGPEADDLVLASDDRTLFHHVRVSDDGRWQIRTQGRFNANRQWLLDMSDVAAEPVEVVGELEGNVEAQIVGGQLVILTDLGAPHWRVMVADLDHPGRASWRELIAERPHRLESITAANGRLYARYSVDVQTRLVMFSLDGRELGEVALPTRGTASVWGRWGLDDVRVTFQSFAHPPAVYRHDPESGRLRLLKASAMPVDPARLARIVVDQVWFTSRDGTQIPMFVVHDVDADKGGPIPLLLTGYGGFDISKRPRFSTTALVWIERGGAYAVPALRGGGEFGQAWHQAGMRERKQNVFDDFLAAASWLIEEGWTTPGQLAIAGGSNGGLLVAAAVTQRPDLFGAVLCSVPLTDMIRFPRFGLADIWTEEYGSPDDPEMFPYLLAYSPYHAVRDGVDYPAILVVGADNDARTDPVHARKFMAAVWAADQDRGTRQPILLHVRTASGHGGGVGIDVRADQTARAHAFLMAQVGL